MKKQYAYPTIEIMPLGMKVALCASGESSEGLDLGTSGSNPWTGGRGPQRTPAF